MEAEARGGGMDEDGPVPDVLGCVYPPLAFYTLFTSSSSSSLEEELKRIWSRDRQGRPAQAVVVRGGRSHAEVCSFLSTCPVQVSSGLPALPLLPPPRFAVRPSSFAFSPQSQRHQPRGPAPFLPTSFRRRPSPHLVPSSTPSDYFTMSAHWTRLRKLTTAWSLFTFLFIASAAILIIVAQIWRMEGGKLDKNTLRTLVIGSMDLTGASSAAEWRSRGQLMGFRMQLLRSWER